MPPGVQKYTRRYHKKSRTGCMECRSRRIKCDESHPSCWKCQRASIACHYIGRSRPQSQSHHSSREEEVLCPGNGGTQAISSIPTSYTTPEPHIAFDMLDLALMHHYTNVTSISLFGEEQQDIWQTEIPLMARSSPLLMHGLLATAALHMAFLHKEEEDKLSLFATRALYHHSLGLQLFNADITTLSSEKENSNSHVLFTFALFLVIWAYASPTIPGAINDNSTGGGGGGGRGDHLDMLLASLELVRGNKVIFELSSETILSQPIGRFTKSTRSRSVLLSQDPLLLPPTISDTLSDLRNQASDFIDTIAIDHLEQRLVQTISTSARDMRQPLGWPVLVETAFWERVRRRKSSALLILMHYAIILGYYEPRAWWIEGWSERLVSAVEDALREQDQGRFDWGVCCGRVKGVVTKVKMGLSWWTIPPYTQ